MPTDPIGEIPVEITGDYGPLQEAFEQAKKLATEWAGKIADGFNSAIGGFESGANDFSEGIKSFIEDPLGSAKDAMVGFVEELGPMGVAAVAAAGALAVVGKEIVNLVLEEGAAAEATSNLANRLNLSYEDTKKLSEMADIAGVSIDSLSRVSMRLADALQDPAGSGKKVAEALEGMGISATSSGDALLKLLQKLAEIPDATERIAKAHEIMGRSAVQLEPLLRDYTSLGEAVDSLGGKLDSEMVEKLKAADDAADKLRISWSHLKENLAAAFAGPVMDGLNLLLKFITAEPRLGITDQIIRLRTELLHLNTTMDVTKASWLQLLAMAPESEGGGGVTGTGKGRAAEAIEKQIRELQSLQEAQKQSKEYNDILDANEARDTKARLMRIAELAAAKKKAAEEAAAAAKREAKENEKILAQYDTFLFKFEQFSIKADALKGIKLAQTLAWPPGFIEDQIASFKAQEDFNKAMRDAEKIEGPRRAAASIKLLVESFKGIGDGVEAMKSLGGAFSGKLAEAVDKTNKNLAVMEDLQKQGLATAVDVELAWNAQARALINQADSARRAQEETLQLQLRWKEMSGADGLAVITQLENLKLKTESLMIATHGLGDVYIGLNNDFLRVFDNLDKGLVKLLTSGGSIKDTLLGIGKSLEQDLIGTFVHGITQGLKKAFIDSGVGQAVSGFLTKVFGDVFGGLFKVAGQAPQVVAETANTTALTANTAAITALTGALGTSGAAGAASQAAGGIGGGGGAAGGLGGLAGAMPVVTAISSAVSAITGVLSYLQGRRMEQDIGRIEVTTRGQLNQLISLQVTLNTYLPQLADRTLGIWSEVMVTNDILRLMGQNGGGLGSGENTGADPNMGEHIAEVINANAHKVADSMEVVKESLDLGVQAYDNYNSGLQTTASLVYSLDSAVTKTTDSFRDLNEATRGVNGALPGFVDGMDKAIFDSMNRVQGGPGQNLTPNGASSNMASVIMPVPIAEALSGPGGFTQGAMLPQVNNPIQYGSIAPVVGGPGVARGGSQPLITVEAVDPSGRQIARATVKGLEEMGIRTR